MSSARPVALIWRAAPDEPPSGIERADDLADVRFAPDADALARELPDADVMFFSDAPRAPLQAAFDAAERLRWIQSGSDGVDGLLFPELVASDVAVTNARGIFEDAIAEWAIGAIVGFAVRILHQRDAQAAARWDPVGTSRVAGSHVVIVGAGPIARAVATRATALGIRVTVVGRTARQDEVLGHIRGVDELHHVLRDADAVLDALPLTASTRRLFDAATFAAMPRTARFLNVGRGGTVDERALTEALSSGSIAGAALDVFEEEPLPSTSPLWSMPNVLISPHMCGDFEGWERAVVDVFVDNLDRFARGEPLLNLVDKSLGFGVG